ncbi:MAG: AAA family ATPase [Planctomycetota bacterium]|nr:MAG: AAA family ATPase [Planctomycetota bacterium]
MPAASFGAASPPTAVPASSASAFPGTNTSFGASFGAASVTPPAALPTPSAPQASSPPRSSGIAGLGELAASATTRAPSTSVREVKAMFDRLRAEIGKIYVGQDELVLGALVALFSGGHVLIESVPGLGKTLFVRTLGRVLGCRFGRIQFTADLMPSDITGAPIFDMKEQEFRFRPGPVFTQLLLADEINRSPAKTHAALLEIMQEYRVTIDGVSHPIERPFLVLATQNPIESEGTYNLPEAQLDRFMFKLVVDYPEAGEEAAILKLHTEHADFDRRLTDDLQTIASPAEILRVAELCRTVRIDDRLIDYTSAIVRQTRRWPQFYLGASPRAGIALVHGARTLAAFLGREFAVPDDVVSIALPALRHRVSLTAEAEVEGRKIDELLAEVIRSVEVPRL